MKNIKQFIGQKVAIHCATQEEWDYIRMFDSDAIKISPGQFKDHDSFGQTDCICVVGMGFIHSSFGFYTNKGYTIIPASDFMPEPQKEIEGWKWKDGYKQKYEDAYYAICGMKKIGLEAEGVRFNHDSKAYNHIKEAGVLELWFNPIYKEVKQWPKKGQPCLVWDNSGQTFPTYRKSNGDGTFTSIIVGESIKWDSATWDNYIELNLTEEQLSKLP